MILAAGLTPAWQHILRFDDLRLGQVNRAAETHLCASGKVCNVGIALAQLGAECRLLTPLGDEVMERAWQELTSLEVQPALINAQQPTRVCATLIDSASGTVTELVENAQPLPPSCLTEFCHEYAKIARQAELVVLSGSLPAETPVTFYRELLAVTPGRVVLDARGPELLAALECRPFVIKPNREELASTLGCKLGDESPLLSAMRELNDRGAQWVVITDGTRAVWVSSTEGIHRLQPLRVEHVINPIGCGDCLAAGLAWSLSQGHDVLQAVRIGIAAAAQNAEQLLPGRINPRQTLELAEKVDCQQVIGDKT
ncbi:MAG TPA: PfkB family carbohydrate kinase [Pirellulales bacterium]|nr:PfkB family carbohydrate kinase [Pirellulales bacterium]